MLYNIPDCTVCGEPRDIRSKFKKTEDGHIISAEFLYCNTCDLWSDLAEIEARAIEEMDPYKSYQLSEQWAAERMAVPHDYT